MSTMFNTTEKRQYDRHLASVELWLATRSMRAPFPVKTRNLSEAGAACRINQVVEPGDLILGYLQLPGEFTTIECKCRVCWTAETDGVQTHCGIRFLDLREEEREVILEFLDRTEDEAVFVV
ncbi:MAG: PilZ domain-containing protein [Candidatus Hydrogenedentes bacterium]|nr:PilZ domain-containing protein [Candidatus Hydrogenedentota bacterium]